VRLVITGLGRHQIVDRLFGDETALRLIRECRVPVLAVPEDFPTDFDAAPRRAIVAMDFSEASLHAAQAVLRLLPPGSSAELVHVMPREHDLGYALIPVEDYLRGVERDFAEASHRLTIPPDVTLQQCVLSGNPALELLRRAGETHASVVAAGSHGYGMLARIIIGSVTSKLLRGATTAVLVVPPDAAAGTLGADSGESHARDLDQRAYA
jgi:nucleotide-binding universal stress UspA family protein